VSTFTVHRLLSLVDSLAYLVICQRYSRRTVLQETPTPATPAGAAPGPRPGQPANGARPMPNPFAPQPGLQRPDNLNFNNNPILGGGRIWNRFIGAVAGDQQQQRGQLPNNLRLPTDPFGTAARLPNAHDGQADPVVLSLPPGTTLRIELPGDHHQAPISENLAAPPRNLNSSPALRGLRGSDGEWRSWNVEPQTRSTGARDDPAPIRTTSNVEGSTSTSAATSQASVPQLIPLYEPEPYQMETTASRDDSSRHASSVPETSNVLSTSFGSAQSRTAPLSVPDQGSSNSTWRPPIPPTLTEEQLAVMDTLTREAIDERIRALERVSEAVYTSIEDLLRMRSRFPVSPPPSVLSTSISSAQAPNMNEPPASSDANVTTQAPSPVNGDIASQAGPEFPASSPSSSSPASWTSLTEVARNVNSDKNEHTEAEAPIDVVTPSPSAFDSPTWQFVPDEHDEEERIEREGEIFASSPAAADTTAATGPEKDPLAASSSYVGTEIEAGEQEQDSAHINSEST
jgi:hypothetical protein